MPGVILNGGRKLQHGAIALTADEVTRIRPANPKRLRIQLFNATAPGTGSTVYAGAKTDVDGGDLAAANGWPLNEAYEYTADTDPSFKQLANVLELFTRGAIYGLASGADATLRFIEELEA